MPVKRHPSVLGMGNALVDVLIPIKDNTILSTLNLPKGSMTLVDEISAKKFLSLTSSYHKEYASGGSAANTIHGIASLGMSTGFIGSIGKDDLGQTFYNSMAEKDINLHLFYADSGTGHAITFITPEGERTFATYLGAATQLHQNRLNEIEFSSYTHLHVEGYLIIDNPLLRKAFTLAKNAGLTISYDLASYNVVEANREQTYSILSEFVDIVFANDEEATALTGKEPMSALEELSGICNTAVVKLGEKGSVARNDEEEYAVPAIPAKVVDTTGAGDLYAAGFLYGYLNGFTVEQSLKTGSLMGGKVIEVTGSKLLPDQWEKIKQQIDMILEY